MQYIECIHCNKRYPATRKMRDAMGRRVRCTSCGKSFPIIIFDSRVEQSSAAAHTAAGDPEDAGRREEQ